MSTPRTEATAQKQLDEAITKRDKAKAVYVKAAADADRLQKVLEWLKSMPSEAIEEPVAVDPEPAPVA